MSDLMREFLESYLKWAKLNEMGRARPLVNGLHFNMGSGLCGNIHHFVEWRQREARGPLRVQCEGDMKRELRGLFSRSGLHKAYPFGSNNYDRRYRCGTQHLDPNRLAWIRDQLGQQEVSA